MTVQGMQGTWANRGIPMNEQTATAEGRQAYRPMQPSAATSAGFSAVGAPMSVNDQTATAEGRQAYSSVELSRTSKGIYSWSVKAYVLLGDEESAFETVKRIDRKLRDEYGSSDDC